VADPHITMQMPTATAASPEEAAAIVAALEHFMRATVAPADPPPPTAGPDGWRRAALLEGVSREPDADAEAADVSWMLPPPG